MAIDVHAHMVPVEFITEVQQHQSAWKGVEMDAGDNGIRLKFPGEPWTRPIAKNLSDLEGRRQWMDERGIHEQWVSGWMDVMGYGLSEAEGAAWSTLLNDIMAAAIKGQSGLVGIASVPLQNPDQAARELIRAVRELGFAGAVIATRIGERELDDPVFEPFWAQAEALRAPVILHPGFTGSEPRLKDYGLANAVGRAAETTLAVSRLLMAGLLARHPRLPLVLVHGGGYLPYQLGRIRRAFQLHHGRESTDRLAAQLGQLWCDSVVFEPSALEFLVHVMGKDQVVLGSDYPFPVGDLDPITVVSASNLASPAQRAILIDNALRLKGGIRR